MDSLQPRLLIMDPFYNDGISKIKLKIAPNEKNCTTGFVLFNRNMFN